MRNNHLRKTNNELTQKKKIFWQIISGGEVGTVYICTHAFVF